jgi:hypothetical protein
MCYSFEGQPDSLKHESEPRDKRCQKSKRALAQHAGTKKWWKKVRSTAPSWFPAEIFIGARKRLGLLRKRLFQRARQQALNGSI